MSQNISLWDQLPECLLNKIYSMIIYKQSDKLLCDIKSYVKFCDCLNNMLNIENQINIILWNVLLYDLSLNNKEKEKKYELLSITSENCKFSYMKKAVRKMRINSRYNILNSHMYYNIH